MDIGKSKIIGDVGIEALKEKIVKVNDISLAKYAAMKKGTSVDEMIRKKAKSLGFDQQ